MTYTLRNDTDVFNYHQFDTEDEARDWAKDNLLADDYSNWTLYDYEGAAWYL